MAVSDLCLFLAVSWVLLQCMIIVYHFLVILPYFSSDYEKLIFDFDFCSLYIFLACLVILYCFVYMTFLKNIFRNTIRMSNSLDPNLLVLISIKNVCIGYHPDHMN